MAPGARLRGTTAGLVLDLSNSASGAEARQALERTLAERRSFLSGASLELDCGSLALSREEVEGLLALCVGSDVGVRQVAGSGDSVRAAAQALGLAQRQEKQTTPRDQPGIGEVTSPDVVETECGLVTGTVRSGHAIWHPGSVIVFGDVNPGAEIVAGGSVVVWGLLRGTVHAGAGGDNGAVVCALGLQPTLLRIGSAIARSPDEASPGRTPELALARDGTIVVEAWAARRQARTAGSVGRFGRAWRLVARRLPGGMKAWGA